MEGILSNWTHSICEVCYQLAEPGREPSRVVYEEPMGPVRCCFCLQTTVRGIFYRADPAECKCPENHAPQIAGYLKDAGSIHHIGCICELCSIRYEQEKRDPRDG